MAEKVAPLCVLDDLREPGPAVGQEHVVVPVVADAGDLAADDQKAHGGRATPKRANASIASPMLRLIKERVNAVDGMVYRLLSS